MKITRKWTFAMGICIAVTFMAESAISSQAADPGPSQDVWLDVAKKDYRPRISVTVPTTFAFVVNGTLNERSRVKISVDNGTLLLPNVVVNVLDHDSITSDYEIGVVGDSTLRVKNYSTQTADQDADGNENYDPAVRQGKAVSLNAFVEGVDSPGEEQGFWKAAAEDAKLTPDHSNFKNFRVSLADETSTYVFDSPDTADKSIWLDHEISLEAPPRSGGYTPSGTANNPYEKELKLGVEVGGYRGQYSKIEESVKAGKIIWQVNTD